MTGSRMDEKFEITVRKVPMLDTGLGQEAGFENDAQLIEAAEAQRAELTPAARGLLEEIDRRVERAFLFGED